MELAKSQETPEPESPSINERELRMAAEARKKGDDKSYATESNVYEKMVNSTSSLLRIETVEIMPQTLTAQFQIKLSPKHIVKRNSKKLDASATSTSLIHQNAASAHLKSGRFDKKRFWKSVTQLIHGTS